MGYDDRTLGLYGDIRYRAPEMIKGSSYNNKVDCWAFGVILFYMLTGHHPYDNAEESPASRSSSSFNFDSDANSNSEDINS